MKPMHSSREPRTTRAEIGNIDWRDDLPQIARLIDRLTSDRDDLELFHLQKKALVHERRRLARWARHAC
jgi:hypothetical protein